MSKRRKRKKKPFKTLLILLLCISLITGFLFLGGSDFFNISKINVEGTSNISTQEIIDASGIRVGENIFQFKAKDAEEQIKLLQRVKNASIVRIYPNKIKIIILERTPFISFSINNNYFVYDDEGVKLFETSNINEISGMIVSGIPYDDVFASDILDFSSSASRTTIYEISLWLQKNNLHNYITEIYISPTGYYYAYTKNSNIIKFYSFSAFESNYGFIKQYLLHEDRHIMLEVIEDSEPVYKVIQIN